MKQMEKNNKKQIWKSNMRLIGALIRLRFQHLMMFRLGFFGPFFVDGSMFAVQLLVFEAIYGNVEKIGPWQKGEMMIFVGTFSLVNALNMIIYFFGINGLADKIKTGEIDLYLTKPGSTLLRMSFERVNPGSIPLLLLSVVILGYGIHVGNLSVTGARVASYVVCVLLMTVLWYEMEVLIRSLAFFVVSAGSMIQLEEAGIGLCMKVPGVAMKGFFRVVFYLLMPYGIMATYPTLCLVGQSSVITWGWAVFITVLFGGITGIVWKVGRKRYNSVSS